MNLYKTIIPAVLLMSLSLTGCAEEEKPEPQPSQTLISVSITSSIHLIAEERILSCQKELPGLLINAKPSAGIDMPETPLELSIWWGNPDDLYSELDAGVEIVQTSSEKAAILVNSDNPIQNLSSQNLKDIFTGAIQKWSELDESSGQGMIQVYTTPAGSDLRQILNAAYLLDSKVATTAEILPSAAAVAEKISENPAGIGLTLEIFLTGSTRKVQISSASDMTFPVLAVIPDNADPAVKMLVNCLSNPAFD